MFLQNYLQRANSFVLIKFKLHLYYHTNIINKVLEVCTELKVYTI